MSNLYKIAIFTIAFIFLSFQEVKTICTVVKDKKFTYKIGSKNVFVSFKNNTHTELHNNKKHYIKSTIEWISDCEYYLIVNETNYPNFPFKIGSKLHVKILNTKNKNVYYKSTMNNKSWEGKLTLNE